MCLIQHGTLFRRHGHGGGPRRGEGRPRFRVKPPLREGINVVCVIQIPKPIHSLPIKIHVSFAYLWFSRLAPKSKTPKSELWFLMFYRVFIVDIKFWRKLHLIWRVAAGKKTHMVLREGRLNRMKHLELCMSERRNCNLIRYVGN